MATILDVITGEKPSLSFEVFPPKTSDTFESVKHATEAIAALHPSYMSVTYGAGGERPIIPFPLRKIFKNDLMCRFWRI